MTDAEKAENESEREGWLLNSKDEDKLTGTNLGIVLDRKASSSQREVQVPLGDERGSCCSCG